MITKANLNAHELNLIIKILLCLIFFISFFYILKPSTYDYYPDLSVYYNTAKVFLAGGNPYSDLENKEIFLYPPPAVLFFVPFTLLNISISGKIFTFFSTVCFLISLYLLLKIIRVKTFSNLGMFLLTLSFNFFPEKFTLGMGQVNNFIFLGVSLFVYFYLRKKDLISGVFLACASAMKVTPFVLILVPLITKRWKIITSFLVSIWTIMFFSYLIVGKETFPFFFWKTLPNLLTSTATYYYNQSLSGFLARMISNPFVFKLSKYVLSVLLFILTVFILKKYGGKKDSSIFISINILIIFGFFLTNNLWQHHLVLFLIPLFFTFYIISKNQFNFCHFLVLCLSYFLVSVNLKNPLEVSEIFWLHGLLGIMILYFYNIFLLIGN